MVHNRHWERVLRVSSILASVAGGYSQTTQHAVCNSGFQWMFNSRNQSPCAVAEALGGVCNGGVFTLPPLETGEIYVGPYKTSANACRCSSVFYSMSSACAACQSASWINWSTYAFTNCTSISVASFPLGLPAGVPIPHYAFQNVSATDGWNLAAAQADRGPESTGLPSPTSTRLPVGPTRASQPSHTNVGAIAGGVVGGVVGLGLIVGAAVFFLCRRRRQPNTTTTVPLAYNSGTPPEKDSMGMGMGGGMVTPFTPPPHSPKIYDPADPTTFPSFHATDASSVAYTTTPPPQMFTQTPQPPAELAHPPSVSPLGRSGGYTGVAEV